MSMSILSMRNLVKWKTELTSQNEKVSQSLSHTVFLSNYMRMYRGPQLQILSIVNLRHINIYEKVRKERGEGAFLDFQSN